MKKLITFTLYVIALAAAIGGAWLVVLSTNGPANGTGAARFLVGAPVAIGGIIGLALLKEES